MADERIIVAGGYYLTSPTTGLVGFIDGDVDFKISTYGKNFTINTATNSNLIFNTKKLQIRDTTYSLELGVTETPTIPTSIVGDSFILSNRNMFFGTSSNTYKNTILGPTTFSSPATFDGVSTFKAPTTFKETVFFEGGISGDISFNNNVTIQGEGTTVEIVNENNPRFVATTPSGQTVLTTASYSGHWFPATSPGDTALRGTKNVHIGPEDAENFSVFITGQLLLNGLQFRYGKGEWTPAFKYVRSSGSLLPQANIVYDYQKGYYIRNGDSCTIFFDFQFTTNGGDAFVGGAKFAAIGNLPYKIGIAAVSNDIIGTAPLTVAEYPDGMAVDLAPAIGSPVFTSGFRVSSYEEGYEVPLSVNQIVSVPAGNWTADGYHLVISADCKLYGVALGIPPWVVINETHAALCNFHITSDLVYYPGCRFAGSITYLTDDPL